ncbi:hypothetical protein D3C86_1874680 [compost metagenome]
MFKRVIGAILAQFHHQRLTNDRMSINFRYGSDRQESLMFAILSDCYQLCTEFKAAHN